MILFMEEIEVPLESLQEEIHHHVHGHSRSEQERWTLWVALSSALFAALAAVTALLSGHHANDAMLDQIRASDHWGQYQAKSIKSSVLRTRIELLRALQKPVPEKDEEKAAEYEREQEEIAREARHEEEASRANLRSHQIFARAVTFSQIAIALGAIAVLTRRRLFFFIGLAAGLMGALFLGQGLFK